jgi:hypothetical protein
VRRLQRGGLQKEGSLLLALQYQVHDAERKNFRTCRGRDQKRLVVKQRKEG